MCDGDSEGDTSDAEMPSWYGTAKPWGPGWFEEPLRELPRGGALRDAPEYEQLRTEYIAPGLYYDANPDQANAPPSHRDVSKERRKEHDDMILSEEGAMVMNFG